MKPLIERAPLTESERLTWEQWRVYFEFGIDHARAWLAYRNKTDGIAVGILGPTDESDLDR